MKPLPESIVGRTMVVISTQDWDDLHTRKQRFSRRFAEAGCKVLYVEAQWHWLTYMRNRHRAGDRLANAGKPPRKLTDNLWLWTPPPQLPFFQMWEPLARWNNRRLAPQLQKALKAIGGDDQPLLYVYTPYNSFLIDTLKPKATVYECVDDHAASKGLIRAETVRNLESKLLRRADACVVTAQALYDQREGRNNHLHLIPNAADIDHFARAASADTKEPEAMQSIPHPRLGFLGGVNYWIDLKLLAYVATSRPDWQIVLVGPVWVDVSELERLRNVHMLGRQPYDNLPEFVSGFDVCLNPYVLDDVASGCSPLKLYEYLAAAKAIVSVAMPEAERFAPPVYIGSDYLGFVKACERALDESAEDRIRRETEQRTIARQHSWDDRFERTVAVWEGVLK